LQRKWLNHKTPKQHKKLKKTIKDVINNIINDIKYEVMETKLSITEKFVEEPTIGHLASLLYYATQFAGGDSSTII